MLPNINDPRLSHFQDVDIECIIKLFFVGEIVIDVEMHAEGIFVFVFVCFDSHITSFFDIVLEAPAVLVHATMNRLCGLAYVDFTTAFAGNQIDNVPA